MDPLLASLTAAFLLVLAGSPFSAQQTPVPVARVEAALTSGDARALGATVSDRVEVSLLGNSGVYSRAQATLVFGRFFARYPAEQPFRFDHRMSAGEGAVYASGFYRHADGWLTVMVRFAQRGPTWEVRDVRAEPGRLE